MPISDVYTALSCPRCGKSLGLSGGFPEEDGEIVCPACAEAYPLIGGVLGLLYPDRDWFWPLHELLSMHDMAKKALGGELERDRVADNAARALEIMNAAAAMADSAQGYLGAPSGRSILEAGCGSCGHAKILAEAGFSVLAVDLNPVDLLHPRPRAVCQPSEDFHASYFDTRDEFPAQEINFARVAADLNNLPIADSALQAAFSRSMLHHLDPLPTAIAEIGRVLAPGAPWAAAAEPTSSLLEWDPMSIVDHSIDYQEGIHEQAPGLFAYLSGLRRGGIRLEEYEVWHAQYRINLGLSRRRRIRISWASGQKAQAGKKPFSKFQLSLMNTTGNFLARRTERPAVGPKALRSERERSVDPRWLFDPSRHEQSLRVALRTLIPMEALSNPATLGRLKHPEIQLIGFRLPTREEGVLARYSTRSSTIFLPSANGRFRNVELEYHRPTFLKGPPMAARVFINGFLADRFTIEKSGVGLARIAIPPEALDFAPALEVRLEINPVIQDGAGRFLGLGVIRATTL